MATDLADRQAIQAQCHKLIGLAGTIGANRLHDVSVRLHQLAEGPCGLNCADLAREVQAVLGRLIQRIGVARAELAARP